LTLSCKKDKVASKLLTFGFVKQQALYILKKFEFERVLDVTNYYGWLIKNKPSKDYSQKYFYYLLNNFDFNKTWAEYQAYYNQKKNTASLDLPKKKSYILSGRKIGEDRELGTKPKNIIEFIKNGTKSKG
jgi:hypothetical protein